MFAQSVVEYGALASIVAGVQSAAETAGTWVATISPTTWAIVGGIVVLVLTVRRRRT